MVGQKNIALHDIHLLFNSMDNKRISSVSGIEGSIAEMLQCVLDFLQGKLHRYQDSQKFVSGRALSSRKDLIRIGRIQTGKTYDGRFPVIGTLQQCFQVLRQTDGIEIGRMMFYVIGDIFCVLQLVKEFFCNFCHNGLHSLFFIFPIIIIVIHYVIVKYKVEICGKRV